MADGIFAGLQVIDCASWIAGPAAATILSDFGAKVIKVEPPQAGDPWRASPAVPGKITDYWWQLTARNKQSLAIDLKHPRDLAFCTACSARRTSSSPTSPCRCASA